MSSSLTDAKTLVELLVARATLHPERVAVRFTSGGEGVTETWRYADVDTRARAVAAALQQHGERERALLVFPTGPEYVAAFLGCLYAGWIAVPAYPPQSFAPRHTARLVSIARDAAPRLLLTTTELARRFEREGALREALDQVEVLALDAADPSKSSAFCMPELAGGEVAFLQYTSGSTANPRGVMVTHQSLLANEGVIQRAFEIGPEDVVVSWLPLFHDMGLVGTLLQPLFSGGSLVLFGTQHFVQRPLCWLETIARFRGTVSGGPDFAYRLCAERARGEVLAGLDLSSWRLAFCGAEPVRPATLHAFSERFQPWGFEQSALYPCYGLAEATLLVSGGQAGRGFSVAEFDPAALARHRVRAAAPGRRLVACGAAREGNSLVLLEPEGEHPVEDGAVGEICVAGSSVTRGYFRREPSSAETFVEHAGQRFLRTGDLGFLHAGQLFITGRKKDLMIVRGQNIYPDDVEATVEAAVEVVRRGRVVAFAVEQRGRECIALAAEVSPRVRKWIEPEAVCSSIAEAVAVAHGEAPALVVLLNAGALPITSSGKLQRSACRTAWQAGTLDSFAVQELGKGCTATAPNHAPSGARSLQGARHESD
jgi:acyl-CoA synthetase (AMP-forming)/AMP-acid ligase II